MTNSNNFSTSITPTFCPGCGNYILMAGLKQAFSKLKIPNRNLVICYDIGCAGNMADFIKTYAVHTLHGRIIPTASGVKIHQPKLTVCAVGGDGGVYGEGLNHLVAAARANINIKVFVSNNQLYSLTTGQASPTTPQGAATKSTPQGTPGLPLDPVKLVKQVNPNVFARQVDTIKNPASLAQAITDALNFNGFSLLDIRQHCVAFGKLINK